MTSYNFVNGIPASQNAELIQGILREEWGYEGLITSDWHTHKEHVLEVKAGNDIKMPIGEPDKLLEALQDGSLTQEELAISVKRLLETILWIE